MAAVTNFRPFEVSDWPTPTDDAPVVKEEKKVKAGGKASGGRFKPGKKLFFSFDGPLVIAGTAPAGTVPGRPVSAKTVVARTGVAARPVAAAIVAARPARPAAPRARLDAALTTTATLDRFDPPVAEKAVRPDPRSFCARYNGKISTACKSAPQFVLIQDVKDKILFSQTTVSDFNKSETCDYPIDFLADAMFKEFKRDILRPNDGVLDVVDMGKGFFTSVDNRRLLIAKKIGAFDRTYGIWIRVHQSTDALTPGLMTRFDARNWGEAVRKRINKAKTSGYTSHPTIMTTNKKGEREPAVQTIALSVDPSLLSGLHAEDQRVISGMQTNGIIRI